MTQFQNKTFSVHVGGDQEYRDNWDRIFKKKPHDPEQEEPCCWGLAHHEWTCKNHPRFRPKSDPGPPQ